MNEAQRPRQDRATKTLPAYGAQSSVPDYILGITYEIWEERRIDQILDYYAEDVVVYGMDGLTRGAAQMVEHTHATLRAFPDRILIGDDVIWSGDTSSGFSSHRVYSPMTNLGPSAFGPATTRQVRLLNVADCEIKNGIITREWLHRDNLALVTQLGIDPVQAARRLAGTFDRPLIEWLRDEHKRVSEGRSAHEVAAAASGGCDDAFAREVLTTCWISGDAEQFESLYAPYCVLQRAPVRIFSGRRELLSHFQQWRTALPDARISIDNVCSQPYGSEGRHIAARWGLAGTHAGSFSGCGASGRPLFILGASHWRVLGGRIVAEWTVFDELALMAQTMDGHG
jgi:predicted ester cyclase